MTMSEWSLGMKLDDRMKKKMDGESDMDRLSGVYSGMTQRDSGIDRESYPPPPPSYPPQPTSYPPQPTSYPPQPTRNAVFAHAGLSSMFTTIPRGHTNPAYQQDEMERDNDAYCNSDSDDEATPSVRNSSEPNYDEVRFDIPHEKLLNGGGAVSLEDIKPHSKPPPQPRNRKSKKKEPNAWDRFQISSKDNFSTASDQFWQNVFKLTKVIVIIWLFVFNVATSVISKICFVMIIANIFPDTDSDNPSPLKTAYGALKYPSEQTKGKTNVMWIWALILMMGAPYVFTCLSSLWRISQTNNKRRPDWRTLGLVLLIETIHMIGLNMLVYFVLPNLDPLSSVLVILSIGVLPGALKMLYPVPDDEERSTAKSVLRTFLSILALAVQVLSIGVWCFHVFRSGDDSFNSIGYVVCLILAPLFTSVTWWENYVKLGNKGSSGVPLLARDVRRCRTRLTLYANLWRLVLTLVLPIAYFGIFCNNKTQCINMLYYKDMSDNVKLKTGFGETKLTAVEDFGDHCYHHLPLVVACIGALGSGLCFKISKIGLKIMTQVVDFSIPLVLATPITIALIFGMYLGFLTDKISGCSLPFPLFDSTSDYVTMMTSDYKYWLPIIAGALGYVSLLLVTSHVWTPGKIRLQRTDKLFTQPLYCGILTDQSLLLNRRRVESDDKHEARKKKISTANANSSRPSSGTTTTDSDVTNTDTPMIYMCATMWHENENEMTQILKSVFRMDEDQSIRSKTKHFFGKQDKDYYEFEAHVFFDDAFDAHKDDEYEFSVNSYVKLLIKTVHDTAKIVYGRMMGVENFSLDPPRKVATPYGGRLVWNLPGGNQLVAHLKDKAVIRHRKRWSQVMYMYYFLGHKLFKKNLGDKQMRAKANNTFLLALDGDVDFQPGAVQLLVDRMKKNSDVGAACGRIHPIGNGAMVWYQKFEYAVSHWLQKAAEDKLGCVLCSPGCFSLFRGSALMDENVMKRYTTPPSEARHYVQYDQGEDRWLCTLLLQQGHRVEYCAASDALTYAPEGFYEFFNQRRRWTPSTMANIMDLLTDWQGVTKKNSEISIAYIMYQGLLMVSSILTPGTIFLMILGSIHLAFPDIDYWPALLVNLVPISIMIILCFVAKNDTQLTYAAILSTAYSLVMMIVIVGLLRQAVHFGVCSVTTIFLSFVAGVFVISAFIHPQEFWCIIHGFLYFLAIPSMSMVLMIYSLSNLHNVSWGTRENKTAADVKKEAEKAKESRLSGILGFFSQCCARGDPQSNTKLDAILDRIDAVEDNLTNISGRISGRDFGSSLRGFTGSEMGRSPSPTPPVWGQAGNPLQRNASSPRQSPIVMGEHEAHAKYAEVVRLSEGVNRSNPMFMEEKQRSRDILMNPYWMEDNDEDIQDFGRDKIEEDEIKFWQELMEEYLKPIEGNADEQKKVQSDLIELRNKVCLIFILINSLFIIVVFTLQQLVTKDDLSSVENGGEIANDLSFKLPCASDVPVDASGSQSIEPISVAFTLVFGILLLVQFIMMILHRLATLLHICASTELFPKKRKLTGLSVEEGVEQKETNVTHGQVYEFIRDLHRNQEEDSDTMSVISMATTADVDDDDEDAAEKKKEARRKWKRLMQQNKQGKFHRNTLGANFRKNFVQVQKLMEEDDTSSTADNNEENNADSEAIGDREVKKIQKKTKFSRVRRETLHTIALMKRDRSIKEAITSSKVEVAKKRWKGAATKVVLDNARNSNDAADGFGQVVKAASAQQHIDKALKEKEEAEKESMITVHKDAENTEVKKPLFTKRGGVTNVEEVGNQSDDSSDYQDGISTFRLQTPHVQDDVWPEENDYAMPNEQVDTLF